MDLSHFFGNTILVVNTKWVNKIGLKFELKFGFLFANLGSRGSVFSEDTLPGSGPTASDPEKVIRSSSRLRVSKPAASLR